MQSAWIFTFPRQAKLNRVYLQQVRPETITCVSHKTNRHRIWAAIKRETLLTLSEGVCSPQEIDAIFKDVLKTPKGPCEQMDVVGLDVVLDIENHYAESRSGLPEEPRGFLQKMIKDGRLGMKNGKGFYEYNQS